MEYKFDKVLKRVLPKGKVKHSKRVADRLKKLPKEVQYAALFHDYIERGGDPVMLQQILPDSSYQLVKLMTSESGESPIKTIQKRLSEIKNEDLKNFLILIKMADRKDNYEKRKRKNILTDKYIKKTKKLVSFLLQSYTGDFNLILDILNNK